MAKLNSTVNKPPRPRASLDHWVGKDQFVGDGVSTDPAMQWGVPKAGVTRRTGEEAGGKPKVEVE